MFTERSLRREQEEREVDARYEPVPLTFDFLASPLQQEQDTLASFKGLASQEIVEI